MCSGRLRCESCARRPAAPESRPFGAQPPPHALHFRGEDVAVQRGSYLKSAGLVRRRASTSTNSEKENKTKKKTWHGDEGYFQRAVMNNVYRTALGSDS